MNINDYQIWTRSTAAYPSDQELVYLALGLGNEAGEFQGVIKKWMRGDFKVNEFGNWESALGDKAIGELGDVLWYLARLVDSFGLTLEEVAQMNHDKLEDRKQRGVIKGSGDNR